MISLDGNVTIGKITGGNGGMGGNGGVGLLVNSSDNTTEMLKPGMKLKLTKRAIISLKSIPAKLDILKTTFSAQLLS